MSVQGQLRIGEIGSEPQQRVAALLGLSPSRHAHTYDDVFRRYWRQGRGGALEYFWIGEGGSILLGWRHLNRMERKAVLELRQRLNGAKGIYDE